MAKKKPFAPPARTVAKPAASADKPSKRSKPSGGGFFSAGSVRETIESIAIAFVLAFLFRTFEAEAFVIPTGSMAPTLMGQHKDLACPMCGYQYTAGASSEDEQLAEQRGRAGMAQPVATVSCPICSYIANVDPATPEGRNRPTYGGDRILVSKFNYDFGEPRRWDVVVFKYPGEAQMNYIKRLVGMPNETVRIWHGDLYVQPAGQKGFVLERRPPDKLQAMAQIVYDNDYVDDSLSDKGWPLRWQSAAAPEAGQAKWTTSDRGRSYQIEAANNQQAWLHYQHFVPSQDDWELLEAGRVAPGQARARLITDYYAYDSSLPRSGAGSVSQLLGLHWVGDLLLEFELEVTSPTGTALLELVEGGQKFRCSIDCQSGEAVLKAADLADYQPKAKTRITGPGRYDVAFANIDNQLVLWINGKPVEFDAPTTYSDLENDKPKWTPAEPLDLAPARIGSQGAGLKASHIRLKRDIYYIAMEKVPQPGGSISDYPTASVMLSKDYQELARFWSTPAEWAPEGRRSPLDDRREALFVLGPDQFFMLGDNSPASMDARLWEREKFVHRDLLVGKALLVFWPHSFNKVPGIGLPFPFFPNFARMGFIR